MAVLAVALYVLSVEWAAWLMIRRVESGQIGVPDLPQLTVPAYVAAGVIMTVASFFNPIGPQLIIPSGVAASFGLNAGILFIPKIVADHAQTQPPMRKPMPLSVPWLILALLAGGFFVAVLGPGVRFG